MSHESHQKYCSPGQQHIYELAFAKAEMIDGSVELAFWRTGRALAFSIRADDTFVCLHMSGVGI